MYTEAASKKMYYQDLIKKRILILGANGLLGSSVINFLNQNKKMELLCSALEKRNDVNGEAFVNADISDRGGIKKIVYDFLPDFIINAAAYTNVDKSETEKELAWKVNVKGVENLAEASRVVDAHLIHFSTDYIFDGESGPYTEKDKPNPLNYYGRTKLASENVIKLSGCNYTVLRTNVLYGSNDPENLCFVQWVIKSLQRKKNIRVVKDQISNPTFVEDLVQALYKVINSKKQGIYHIGGEKFLSRYDFALKIADYFSLDKNFIIPIITDQLKQPARRPLKSGLVIIKAAAELGFKPRSFEESFSTFQKNFSSQQTGEK